MATDENSNLGLRVAYKGCLSVYLFEQEMKPSHYIPSLEIIILQGNLNITGFDLWSKCSKNSSFV